LIGFIICVNVGFRVLKEGPC